MADPCVVKSGEKVEISDPRLNDTGCTIEPGVIIRPPTDLSVQDPVKAQVFYRPKNLIKTPPVVVTAPIVKEHEAIKEIPPEPKKISDQVVKHHASEVAEVPASDQHTEVPSDPAVTVTFVAGAIAAAGAAAVASSAGGISTIQAKIASIFGSKATVATAAAVTAGTIVAVKAIEHKMKNLESDLEKTKKEVGDTASSIDRIDALLDKLGS
jgi:hypothetical protein